MDLITLKNKIRFWKFKLERLSEGRNQFESWVMLGIHLQKRIGNEINYYEFGVFEGASIKKFIEVLYLVKFHWKK